MDCRGLPLRRLSGGTWPGAVVAAGVLGGRGIGRAGARRTERAIGPRSRRRERKGEPRGDGPGPWAYLLWPVPGGAGGEAAPSVG